MILEESINKLLRDTTDLLLGSQGYTIKAKQKNAPRPRNAYGDVDFVTANSIGWEQSQYKNRQGDEMIDISSQVMREVMMSINFYRDNAIDNANKVHLGIVRESIQTLFRQAGIGLLSRSEVREISESLENGWEERAQFDVFLSVVGEDEDVINSIGSIDISSEFQIRNITYNSHIEV